MPILSHDLPTAECPLISYSLITSYYYFSFAGRIVIGLYGQVVPKTVGMYQSHILTMSFHQNLRNLYLLSFQLATNLLVDDNPPLLTWANLIVISPLLHLI